MTVLYYQLFIAFTIAMTGWLVPRFVLVVCGVWTVFTLINLFYPPLIVIQLGVIWGSFYLWRKRAKRAVDKHNQVLALSYQPEEVRARVQEAPEDVKQVLSGKAHNTFFHNALRSASSRLIIVSGWMNAGVVDKAFLRLLRHKLSEGVNVYIGYGWKDGRGNHAEHDTTPEVLAQLNAVQALYPDRLFIREYGTHEKLLIKDSEFVVFGSHNWLSNRRHFNRERSIILYSEALANEEAETAILRIGGV